MQIDLRHILQDSLAVSWKWYDIDIGSLHPGGLISYVDIPWICWLREHFIYVNVMHCDYVPANDGKWTTRMHWDPIIQSQQRRVHIHCEPSKS